MMSIKKVYYVCLQQFDDEMTKKNTVLLFVDSCPASLQSVIAKVKSVIISSDIKNSTNRSEPKNLKAY